MSHPPKTTNGIWTKTLLEKKKRLQITIFSGSMLVFRGVNRIHSHHLPRFLPETRQTLKVATTIMARQWFCRIMSSRSDATFLISHHFILYAYSAWIRIGNMVLKLISIKFIIVVVVILVWRSARGFLLGRISLENFAVLIWRYWIWRGTGWKLLKKSRSLWKRTVRPQPVSNKTHLSNGWATFSSVKPWLVSVCWYM